MADPKLSRGYRNRNPGNLNYIARNPWRGQVALEEARPGVTPRFGVYDTHENGIRAIVMQLRRYWERGKDTIKEMIETWAPPEDANDTNAYVNVVARKVGIAPTTPFPFEDDAMMTKLVTAIIEHECGGNPYAPETIEAGVASSHEAGHSLVAAAKTGTGTAAIQVGAAAAAAAAVAPAVQSLNGLHPAVGVAVVIAAVLIIVLVVILRRRAQ